MGWKEMQKRHFIVNKGPEQKEERPLRIQLVKWRWRVIKASMPYVTVDNFDKPMSSPVRPWHSAVTSLGLYIWKVHESN